ncbi:helix-turn-helix transcriptional regulator [uncultured Brevundimonas sp.]|uniref:helix-turn-helix domain-containing protein n=1 Tax=uncultured Brevundimonas sp. TaxID=213418 RepID=UPI0025F503A0|nr:helix-turn-helix transcriptional regulator [uncultured Brevundimonas sp.]
MQDFFDFADVEFKEAYVEESFVAEVQHEITRLMKTKGITRAELARRMSVSAPHVTQMLGDEDANLTLRTVARIFDALGEKASIGVHLAATELETKSAYRQLSQLEWGCVVSNDRWSHDDDLGRAQEGNGSVVVWMDAVRRAA